MSRSARGRRTHHRGGESTLPNSWSPTAHRGPIWCEEPRMKFISVVSGCYNEEDNVRELHERVCRVFAGELPEYTFEFIIIDNASQDGTVKILKEIAAQDKRVKVIVNNRNFGHVRSPYHAMLQASGEAIIYLASDLEDPPEMIPQFVRKWEEGYKIVLAQKTDRKSVM